MYKILEIIFFFLEKYFKPELFLEAPKKQIAIILWVVRLLIKLFLIFFPFFKSLLIPLSVWTLDQSLILIIKLLKLFEIDVYRIEQVFILVISFFTDFIAEVPLMPKILEVILI